MRRISVHRNIGVGSVDGVDDVEQGDLRRWPGEPVAAEAARGGVNDAGADERLQRFGKVGTGDSVVLGQPCRRESGPLRQGGEQHGAVRGPLDPFVHLHMWILLVRSISHGIYSDI